MAFLRKEAEYADMPRPDLILLDLDLPRMNGREVLEEIKGDGKLKRIPVVILTSSKDEQDVLKSYGLHANCYVVKPVDFRQFAEVVKSTPIPILVLGGEKAKTETDALRLAAEAVAAGARGVVFGRNVIESKRPDAFLAALKQVVKKGMSPSQAAKEHGIA